MRSAKKNLQTAATCAALSTALACGSDVPLGTGDGAVVSGGSGGTSGAGGALSAGSGGSLGGGAGTSGGRGGSGGSAGSAAGGNTSGGTAAGGNATGGSATAGRGGVGDSGVGGNSVGGAAGAGAGGSGGLGASGGAGGSTSALCPVETSSVARRVPVGERTNDLVIADGVLYFVSTGSASQNDGRIRSVPVAAGGAQDVATAALYPTTPDAFASPDSLTVSASHLYWRAQDGGSIWRQPLAGGTPVKLSDAPVDPFGSFDGVGWDKIELTANHVYWIHGPTTHALGRDYHLYRAAIGGGPAEQLTTYTQLDAVDDANTPLGMSSNATDVFVSLTSASSSRVAQVQIADGSQAINDWLSWGIAADGDTVFTSSSKFAFAYTGSAARAVTSGLGDSVFFSSSRVFLDDDRLLMTATGVDHDLGGLCCQCGWVLSMPKTGTLVSPTVLFSGKSVPAELASDASAIVFANNDSEGHELVFLNR